MLALLGVVGGKLPVFFGLLDALEEPLLLLFVGDMEKELADGDAVARQVALEAADILKTFLLDIFCDQVGRQLLLL